MAEPIAGYGNEVGICGSPDGSTWEKVSTVDGKLQIDVESTGNPSNLDIAISALRDAICAAAPSGNDLADLYGALGDLSDDLAALLTELQAKADLDETQPVSLATAPTTAVTVADGVDVAQGAVADAAVAAGAAGSLSAKLRRLTTDLDALLTELKLKADLTETQPVSLATAPTTTVIPAASERLIGFADTVEEAVIDDDLPAGNSQINGTAVPEGEIWVITNGAISFTGTVPTEIRLKVEGLDDYVVLLTQVAPVTGRWYSITLNLFLKEGEYMRAQIIGATEGDDLQLRYRGYKMAAP